MNPPYSRTALAFLLFIGISLTSFSQTKERSEIEDKYKWDMTEIYTSVDAWRADKEVLKQKADVLASFKGRLTLGGWILSESESPEWVLWNSLNTVPTIEGFMEPVSVLSGRVKFPKHFQKRPFSS